MEKYLCLPEMVAALRSRSRRVIALAALQWMLQTQVRQLSRG